MQHAISKDGTRIAFEKLGRGPALVIAGGALANHQFYSPLAAELAKDFTVFNFDRRGRGESGDTQPYSVEREIEDVAALMERAGAPVFLYGHSAGAVLALRVAATRLPIRQLVLADPPFSPRGDNDVNAAREFALETAHVEEMHRRADPAASARYFLGTMGMPDADIDALLNSPAGPGLIDGARALHHEYAMLGDGLVPAELARRIRVPTIILTGEAMQEAAAQLADAIHGSRIVATHPSSHEMSATDMAAHLRSIFGH